MWRVLKRLVIWSLAVGIVLGFGWMVGALCTGWYVISVAATGCSFGGCAAVGEGGGVYCIGSSDGAGH